jgi:hypothetical protein
MTEKMPTDIEGIFKDAQAARLDIVGSSPETERITKQLAVYQKRIRRSQTSFGSQIENFLIGSTPVEQLPGIVTARSNCQRLFETVLAHGGELVMLNTYLGRSMHIDFQDIGVLPVKPTFNILFDDQDYPGDTDKLSIPVTTGAAIKYGEIYETQFNPLWIFRKSIGNLLVNERIPSADSEQASLNVSQIIVGNEAVKDWFLNKYEDPKPGLMEFEQFCTRFGITPELPGAAQGDIKQQMRKIGSPIVAELVSIDSVEN